MATDGYSKWPILNFDKLENERNMVDVYWRKCILILKELRLVSFSD